MQGTNSLRAALVTPGEVGPVVGLGDLATNRAALHLIMPIDVQAAAGFQVQEHEGVDEGAPGALCLRYGDRRDAADVQVAVCVPPACGQALDQA